MKYPTYIIDGKRVYKYSMSNLSNDVLHIDRRNQSCSICISVYEVWLLVDGYLLWDGFIWPYVTCCITIVLHPVTHRVNALYFHCDYSIVSLTTWSDLLSTCDKSCSNDNVWSLITSRPLTWVLFWVSAWPIWFIFASTFGQVMNKFSFNWP